MSLKRGKMNKRGQFYLIGAVVIIAIIIGFSVITTAPKKTTPVKLYDLGQELGIESQNVIAYGTYNQLNDSQMKQLMTDFVNQYVDYAGSGKNLYFVFGNSGTVIVMGYQELNETVSINVGNGYIPLKIGSAEEFTPTGTLVTIKIEDQIYSFNLATGQNFYFVISQQVQGEKYVITG